MKADPRLLVLIAGAGMLSTWMTMAAVNCETDCPDYTGVITLQAPNPSPTPPQKSDREEIAAIVAGH
ncbi:hypothetical protein [Haloferula sp. BvORR071]|uniref:hypothetical protein n=1 Tax=Haloferula sp. BvORR071 TaxID=1396141 RepID=UPI00055873BF|nr:hypothetical protein [Haloferula sp. BvORR071]